MYCLEEVDNGAHLNDLILPRNVKLTAKFDPKLLGGVVSLRARARRADRAAWRGALYRFAGARTRPLTLKAVPYCVWDNRAPGEMPTAVKRSRHWLQRYFDRSFQDSPTSPPPDFPTVRYLRRGRGDV